MLDKTHITQLLKLNGVDSTAPDEEIRSILLSARWHEKDVDTALLILRENKQTHEMRVETINGNFFNDERLRPETISALLGIDVDIPKEQLSSKARFSAQLSGHFGEMLQIALYSVCISLLFVVCSMWYLHVGMFHLFI